ncbi:MAG: YajQ family cyclic di-GMP-binding protein [Mycobacteriales bacterium]
MADASFDVVSKVDKQEVDNALRQAAKEIAARYDFKDTGAAISWSGEQVEIRANSEPRVLAALEVFQERLVRRGVSLKALEHGEPKPAAAGSFRLVIALQQGISDEKARAIAKKIRADAPRGVQAQIQGDQLRVSGKKRDDLQAVIAMLREEDFGVPLQFVNYR